jgi:hypothetical protein
MQGADMLYRETYSQPVTECIVCDITRKGHLVIENGAGTQVLSSGEVFYPGQHIPK